MPVATVRPPAVPRIGYEVVGQSDDLGIVALQRVH
jgi:hypothetical protein